MKTTAVWCLVIAISVLAVTESSKRNSTGRYKQSICLLIHYMRESTISVVSGLSWELFQHSFPASSIKFSLSCSCYMKRKTLLDLFFSSHELTLVA